MSDPTAPKDDKLDALPTEGRGPAYPYLSLSKAIDRADQIRAAGVARSALPPAGFYKIWGYKGETGPSRQVMAALNHYDLVNYIGRGTDRKVKLSELALKIVLDKVPNSPARAAAIKEAALKPPIFAKLLEAFPFGIGTDAGIETYLTLTCGYTEAAATNVLSTFKDTLEFAGLNKPDNLPDETTEILEVEPLEPNFEPNRVPPVTIPPLITGTAMPMATAENDIKVLLDGNRIRVSAFVDLKGLKRLKKILDANAALLEGDDEGDTSEN